MDALPSVAVQQLENSQRRFEATNARIAQQMRQQRENMGKTSGVQSPESVKPPKKESEALEEEVQFFEKRLNFLKESRKNEKLYWSTIQRHESGALWKRGREEINYTNKFMNTIRKKNCSRQPSRINSSRPSPQAKSSSAGTFLTTVEEPGGPIRSPRDGKEEKKTTSSGPVLKKSR